MKESVANNSASTNCKKKKKLDGKQPILWGAKKT
jgi:hypothetical protein